MLKIRAKIEESEKLVVTGSQTQETSSRQCSATEPWQPDNHQLSQSSIYTASTECLRDITICLSTWGVIFVLEDFFKFLPCHMKMPPGDSKAEGTQVHLGMTTFLKTVRQCKSYWIHTTNLILGESLLTIKLYLIMTSFLTKLTSFF